MQNLASPKLSRGMPDKGLGYRGDVILSFYSEDATDKKAGECQETTLKMWNESRFVRFESPQKRYIYNFAHNFSSPNKIIGIILHYYKHYY